MFGLAAGAGLVAGYHRGDVEDLSGRSTSTGIALGPVSFELTFDMNNSWTGFNIGLLKSLGLGIYSVEAATDRKPTHTSNRTCK